ncbi:uncharacterized protein (TIGR02588 family) [Pararhizobium capsulatum DSM 1112]|uniref:Uncharacterized protein (TIGR02588 family) n=1 Tax=Pararhizobium capsulatum DSM 1112 TaxID=1121113 RepID=A0ABU0BNF7_9HYPH|nr:TIGR02588 family protein [Pararhizobium capsulatum]MDQ0319254.1 uncharacterized protein (TIGR02588 family) [Pararhizobium capsulatum DSM 1112]
MSDTNDSNDRTRSRRVVDRDAHWIEWATGAVSALIVLAMIAWIAFQAPGEQDGLPELRVQVANTHKTGNGYRLAFTIYNDGRRTAAAVPVTGRLLDGTQLVEEREVTLDYVPAQSNVSGALLFNTDPGQHSLEISASGYEDP